MIDKKEMRDYIRECRSKEELEELKCLVENSLNEVKEKLKEMRDGFENGDIKEGDKRYDYEEICKKIEEIENGVK